MTPFEKRLRALESNYHINHPFNIKMTEGKLSKEQVQNWVANRFYYQITIPRKDAAILANCPDIEVRRRWMQRIIDHDAPGGGIDAWLTLGEACGLSKEELTSQKLVLPSVRFAVDAYYHFAKEAPWQEACCSSLTELFAPQIHQQRLDNWPEMYPWIDKKGYTYFRNRLKEARRDVEHGLEITLKHFKTPEQQDRAVEIVQFKLDILWAILDALEMETKK